MVQTRQQIEFILRRMIRHTGQPELLCEPNRGGYTGKHRNQIRVNQSMPGENYCAQAQTRANDEASIRPALHGCDLSTFRVPDSLLKRPSGPWRGIIGPSPRGSCDHTRNRCDVTKRTPGWKIIFQSFATALSILSEDWREEVCCKSGRRVAIDWALLLRKGCTSEPDIRSVDSAIPLGLSSLVVQKLSCRMCR